MNKHPHASWNGAASADKFRYVSTHDFKTNFSKYLREMQMGKYKGVVVTSYGRPVGAFVPQKM